MENTKPDLCMRKPQDEHNMEEAIDEIFVTEIFVKFRIILCE